MELNEKYKSYQDRLREVEGKDSPAELLRPFHIAVENIYDKLKTKLSPADFKWLFIIMAILLLAMCVLHIIFRHHYLSILFIGLMAAYWVYYRMEMKKTIEIQKQANAQIKLRQTPETNFAALLLDRIDYIKSGMDVLYKRIKMVRNQYIAFFPLILILFIHTVRGQMSTVLWISSIAVSIIIGGVFWFYYFNYEMMELDKVTDELEEQSNNLKQYV